MSKIVNVYKLIGLSDFEQDQEKIEKAIKRVVIQQRQAKSEDPQKASKLARIFELAKANLLNPKRKSAYDEQLRRQQSSSVATQPAEAPVEQKQLVAAEPVSAENRPAEVLAAGVATQGGGPAADWDWQSLESVFPNESPDQPFDLAGYLEDADDPGQVVDGEAEYLKLRKLLDPSTPDPKQPAGNSAPATASQPAIQPSNLLASATPPVVNTAAPAKPKVASIARKMRKKRDRSLLLIVGGVLASLAAVLLVLFLIKDRPSAQQVAANPNPNPVLAPRPATNPERSAEPRQGSGLPQVKGLEPGASLSPMTSPLSPTGQMTDAMPNSRSNSDNMDAAMTPAMPMQSDPPMSSEPEPKPPTDSTEPSGKAEPTEITLDDSQKQEWKQSMLAIRQLLGEQKFSEATARLDVTAKLALTEQQKEQHARLVQLHELSKDFQAALLKSIDDLKGSPGAEFSVKSTKVLFVDGTSDSVTLRLTGKRDATYKLTELPVGIAYGLADLSLDQVNQRTAGRKAAFALVHPMSNELVMPRARRFMSEAIAAKVVRDDMLDVFDDDYSLD